MIAKRKHFSGLRIIAFITSLATCFTFSTFSQPIPIGGYLNGEQITSTTSGAGGNPAFVSTTNQIYQSNFGEGTRFLYDEYTPFYTPPKGKTVTKIAYKMIWNANRTSAGRVLVIQLSDGTVIYVHFFNNKNGYGYEPDSVAIGRINSLQYSEGWVKLVGDALYSLSSSYVYVNRNNDLMTWQVDTTGFNGAHVWDIALDSSQNVYAATTNGLFKQPPDSTGWNRIASLTQSTNLYGVFVDRSDRILVGGNGSGLYLSTDRGTTWVADTMGIGTGSVSQMTDDAFGNLYITASTSVTSYTHLFRSLAGSGAWQETDTSITRILGNSTGGITAISGDTILQAGTPFGVFISTDQGTTWKLANSGIRSAHISGIAKTRSGKLLLSNALGIFSNTPPDTVWTQSYPQNGYESGLSLFHDHLGNIYTLDAFMGNFSGGAVAVVKSTDDGTSWSPDTVGLDSVGGSLYYVDGTGVQHYGSTRYGSSWKSSLWNKNVGGSWTIDTSGFPVQNYSYASSMVSDDQSFLYVSGYFAGQRVMRRPLAGGTWVVDTAGLPPTINYFTKMAGNRRRVVGLSGSTLLYRSSNSWAPLSLPSQLSYPIVSAFCVDDSGYVFAAFQNYLNIGLGVFFTRDSGATWTKVGLDSVSVNSLVSFGDSTYALTYDAGAFYVGKNPSVTSVIHTAITPRSFALFQNYPNPFNPSTAISFQLAAVSKVSLKIYDLLGREVATLVNGEMSAGVHKVTFDASKLASGIYFYRLQAGKFTATKKLVLLK